MPALPPRLLAAAAAATLAATASAAELEIEVRGASAPPSATFFYGARRCIPFVSCRFELNLLGGPSRFEPKNWRRRATALRDGEGWRLRVDPRPWTLGAYALDAAVIEVGDGARVYLHLRGERAPGGAELRVEHPLDEEHSAHDVGAPDGLRRVVVDVRARPTLASMLEGAFLASAEEGWAWDEARGRFAHGSGATLAPAAEENGFVTLRAPAGVAVELPVRWEGFWRRGGEPAGMTVEHVAVPERALRDARVTILDVRSRAFAPGPGPASPVDRTLVVDLASWRALRALPAASGVDASLVRSDDGWPRALSVRATAGAAPAVVCVAAWHATAGALGPACARVEAR